MPRNRTRALARIFAIAVWAAIVLMGLMGPALGDELTVKGTVLRGKILEVTSKGIHFETDYGEGKIVIPYENIEDLKTEEPLLILHGDFARTTGRLLGVDRGKLLLVGDDLDTAAAIDVNRIVDSDTMEELENPAEALRNRFRFWRATLTLGLSFEDSTTDELDVKLSAEVERRKKPTRLFARVNYLFGRDNPSGEPSRVTDNEIRGLLKGEYDFTERFFLYMSHDFEYDEIDRLSLRWIGKSGPGYRVFDNDRFRLQLETGAGYNYERFFGGETNDRATIAFGTEAYLALPRRSGLTARADYLPAVEDWASDYLIRAEATLTVPITRYLSTHFSLFETYDNTPDENSEKNELRLIAGLSWRF